jgi:hypothetical protein
MPGAMAAVGHAIDEVRTVMTDAGYTQSDYRFVLQSYPSPVPRGAEDRYPESGWSRLDTGGCPFWSRDLDWARDSLVTQISDNLRSVAAGRGLEFLDLRDTLQGREVRSTASWLSDGAPAPTTSEWTRFLVSGVGQGDLQESFHPNAYTQRRDRPLPDAAVVVVARALCVSQHARAVLRRYDAGAELGAGAPSPIGQLTPVPPRPQ